jgi:hypothetical protein
MFAADEDKTINARKATNALGAYLNAVDRSEDALENMPDRFTDKHLDKVNDVLKILREFFGPGQQMYVNHRENRGKPFTAIKVNRPFFPNHLSSAEKDRRYRQPLRDLGVEIVFSTNTNSYIYRIKCD